VTAGRIPEVSQVICKIKSADGPGKIFNQVNVQIVVVIIIEKYSMG
jgi:hypothetical protein